MARRRSKSSARGSRRRRRDQRIRAGIHGGATIHGGTGIPTRAGEVEAKPYIEGYGNPALGWSSQELSEIGGIIRLKWVEEPKQGYCAIGPSAKRE